ncbi:carcinoembryonic antigen-related cell adhesion molecule 6-like, partial [Suncus etruscus]|uniref:carcinoembryonic antigen-related cell adhesion molecule 6-like n=1 Tax=Suncus etruscus TaxID=109475 RepID=UPI00210F7234
ITNGPAHIGKETLYSNGSLLIRNLAIGDSGTYFIQVVTVNLEFKYGKGELGVYALLPKPYIMKISSPWMLICEPKSPNVTYQWFLNSQPALPNSRLQLSPDNRTLTLLHTTRKDAGSYVCETSNPVSVRRSEAITKTVNYGPDTPTISLTQRYYSHGVNLHLSCLTESHPPAKFSWFIDEKFLGSTQNLSIPKLSLSDSGSYSCIVSNSAMNRSKTVMIHIAVLGTQDSMIPDSRSPPRALWALVFLLGKLKSLKARNPNPLDKPAFPDYELVSFRRVKDIVY